MTTNSFMMLSETMLHRFWFKDQANSGIGRDTDDLYMFIFWVSTISFLFVVGLMLLFVARYHRRRSAAAYQVSVHHNTVLELAWSIIPLLVMVVIFFWGFNGFVIKLAAPANAEEIWVTGSQWRWDFKYSNGKEPGPKDLKHIGNKDSNVMVVPTGRAVKLIMTSTDVIHSFFIPGMRTKMDVFPNRYTSIWFLAEEAGRDHEIQCAEYCGQDHSEMAGWVRTVSEAEFRKWKAEEPDLKPIPMGRYLYRSKGCASCHTLDGAKSTGPTWFKMFGHEVKFTDGSKYTDEQMSDAEFFANYVRESILTPQAKLVESYGPQMNSFQGQIRLDQINAIIAFLKSSEVTDRPAPDPDAVPNPADAPAPPAEPKK